MTTKYPRIMAHRRKPDPEQENYMARHELEYGKPCIICGKGTVGEKWVQTNYMRGDDELVRVCGDHWKLPTITILERWLSDD